MSVILTGPSPLVPRPEEGGARTAGAHFTDEETEAHSSMPKFTLQAAEGVGTHPGVHPESSARVWGPQSGALPTTVPLSASLRCRGGALPFHERAFSLLPISASVLGSLQGTRHIGGHGVGDGEEMTPKGNTNHVEKDLFFKNSPSCLSSRAGVHSLHLPQHPVGQPLRSLRCPAVPQPAARLKVPRGPGSGLLSWREAGGLIAPKGAAGGPCEPRSLPLQLPCCGLPRAPPAHGGRAGGDARLLRMDRGTREPRVKTRVPGGCGEQRGRGVSGRVQVGSWPQAPALPAGCGECRGVGAESSSWQRGRRPLR